MSVTDPTETLDPADWQAMRALAHRAVDDGFDWLSSVRERPVWRPTPDAIVANFHQPLPRTPQGAERAEIWAFMEKLYPPYKDYQKATKREIPLVVMAPGDEIPVFKE